MRSGHGLVVAALVVAAADWGAVARGARRAETVLKPLATTLLLAAVVAFRSGAPSARWTFTLVAVACSLAGDAALLFAREGGSTGERGRSRAFLAGLAAFLLAHVAYIAAFTPSAPPALPTIPAAVAVAIAAVVVYRRLLQGMRARGETAFAVPVAVYVVALGAMVTSAAATAGRPDWDGPHAALAIAGAVLFMASDALIGWQRFVRERGSGPVAVMVTYHLAQAALVLSLLG